MTDKEVLQRFKKDFDQIEPPDIWDKIQEQKKTEPLPVPPAKNKVMHLNHVIAACVALFVVGAGIFVFMQMQRGNGNVTEEPSETSRNLIEQLTMAKSHGDFALSKRDRKSLEELFPNYDEDTYRVYEDNEYIYYFNKDGKLISILNLSSATKPDTEEKDIENKVKELFGKYCPDENIDDRKIEIEHPPGANPAWYADIFYLYGADIYIYRMSACFDETGTLLRLSLYCGLDSVGNISIEQAVQTAIDEAKSGKYVFDDFDREDIGINFDIVESKEKTFYTIHLIDVPIRDDADILSYEFKKFEQVSFCIDADTGEFLYDYSGNPKTFLEDVSSNTADEEFVGTVNEEYVGTYVYRMTFDASALNPDISLSSEQIENIKKKVEGNCQELKLNADGTASLESVSNHDGSFSVQGNVVKCTWVSDGSVVYVTFGGNTSKYIYDNGTLTDEMSNNIYVKQ